MDIFKDYFLKIIFENIIKETEPTGSFDFKFM